MYQDSMDDVIREILVKRSKQPLSNSYSSDSETIDYEPINPEPLKTNPEPNHMSDAESYDFKSTLPKFTHITLNERNHIEMVDLLFLHGADIYNDGGIQFESIIVDDKEFSRQLTIPFYCYRDNPMSFEEIAAECPYHILTCDKENYFTCDCVNEFDDYIIFTLSFFSESRLNFTGFTNNLNEGQLRNYYYQCNVISKTQDKTLFLRRQGFDTLYTIPYLWNRNELKLKELECDENNHIIIYNDAFEEAFTFPTFHKYTDGNLFQPMLGDVFDQIPLSYGLKGPFLVTTEMISNDPEIMVQGDYHVGKTTIYTPVPQYNNKKVRFE